MVLSPFAPNSLSIFAKVNLLRRLVFKRLMKSLLIVKVEISAQSLFCVGDRLILVEIDFLILDASPQSFNEDIVKDATSSISTNGNLGSLKPKGKRFRGELAPLVRVKNVGLALCQCLFKS